MSQDQSTGHDWRADPLERTPAVRRGAIRHSCISCGSVWYADHIEHCPRCDQKEINDART